MPRTSPPPKSLVDLLVGPDHGVGAPEHVGEQVVERPVHGVGQHQHPATNATPSATSKEDVVTMSATCAP